MVKAISRSISCLCSRRNVGTFFDKRTYMNSRLLNPQSTTTTFREGFRPLKDWNNKDIWILSRSDNWDAHAERLFRNVLHVEKDEAQTEEIVKNIHNDAYHHLRRTQFPYYISMFGISTLCVLSIPLTFNKDMVSHFNEHWVTAPLPDETPDTTLEIGAWAWTWMEPMSGTFCFILLCMSLNRSFMKRAGLNPYPNYMLQHRIQYICKKYPKYDPHLLRRYVKHVDRPWEKEDHGPELFEYGGAPLPELEEIWTPPKTVLRSQAAQPMEAAPDPKVT